MTDETADSTTTMQLPGPTLTVPTDEGVIAVGLRDWTRLRRCVDNLKEPIKWASNAGWTAVGVATSALLGLIPWMAAESQLPDDAKVDYRWVAPALAILGVAAVAVAVLSFLFAKSQTDAHTSRVTELLGDMDSIHSHTP